ncbi:hypothetical protein EYF80_043408 [Liparis tanakae]|uniref:Uncharacterized protein n=1 Tax=Liparis tanakae TaxID=230148 RepID=A0A4Z2FYT5_9TELE|nr:hypothetical protein EYF80_043408 [Liparis tanakae]
MRADRRVLLLREFRVNPLISEREQVEEEPRGGRDLQHHHHDHHHGHPHPGGRVAAPRPARPAGRDHHVGGGLAAHRPEVVLLLLLLLLGARSGHGIPGRMRQTTSKKPGGRAGGRGGGRGQQN